MARVQLACRAAGSCAGTTQDEGGKTAEYSDVNQVYLHSCERMAEVADGTVQLTVTSPPYWNAIDYDAHTVDPEADYRRRAETDYEEYLTFLRRCFTDVLRVHRPGSHCAVVLGTVLLNRRHTPLPFHFVPLMEGLGWEFHQDIVWYKCTGGVKRAGSTVQHPYPGYYYPNLMTEYILLFRKPGGEKIYAGRSGAEKDAARYDVDTVFTREIANNIWHVAPVPPGQLDHPCAFPEEIPHRLVRLFTFPGDLVLDPFAGVGTTLKVAGALGRRWVGYEIRAEYRDAALRRTAEPFVPRKQLVCGFEKVDYGARLPARNRPRAPFRKTR